MREDRNWLFQELSYHLSFQIQTIFIQESGQASKMIVLTFIP